MSKLELNDEELIAVLSAIHVAICKKLFWGITPAHPIKQFSYDPHKHVLSAHTQAYAKCMMLVKDRDIPKAIDSYKLSDDVWDLIRSFEQADDWDDLPRHDHKPWECDMCDYLSIQG